MFFVNQDYLYGKNKYYADKCTLHGSSDRMDLPQTVVERSQSDGSDEGVKQLAGMALKAGGAAAALGGRLAKRTSDYLKSDDAKEKMNAAKNKAQALASGTGAALASLKGKAAAFAAERKKSSDEKIPIADEYDTEENYDVSSDETVYQSDEDYSYEVPDQIADDDTSYEYETNTSVPSAPMNTSSVYNAGTYSYNNEKKSPIIYILIGVISVLLIVLGVLFGMFLMKNKNEKNNNSRTNVMYDDLTETTLATEETTTAVDSNTQTNNSNSDQYTSDEVSAMFSAYIAENPDPNRTYDNSSDNADYGYALIDLNSDSKQELLISSGENDDGIPMLQAAYAINNNNLKQLWISDIRIYGQLCEDNYIYASYIYGSGYGFGFLKYSSGDKFDLIESIEYDGSDYSTTGQFKITYNGNSLITENEADSIIEKYKPIKFESKPLKITLQQATKEESSIESKTDTTEAVRIALQNHMRTESVSEYFDPNPQYALYDINADGIDELFISYHNVESTGSDLYIYKNGEYIKIHNFYTGADICLSEQLLRENVYGGGEMTKIYVISDNEILQKDELKQLSGTEFYHNDFVISESEYNQLKSTYDSMNWIYVPVNSRAFSDLIDMSAYNQNNTVSSDPYADIKQEIINSVDNADYSGKNSHIENAPSDMRFYNMSERYNMNVSSPDIYTGPSTDYSKIDVYSDFFWVYGENSDWYYVQWSEGNGAFSHSCYGYMSKSSSNSGSKYTEFDTSAAGSDFEFYSGYFVGCRVATQSGNLNLRAAPSTTAEVIIQMPKDAYVQVLGNNADWNYVSYTDNGTTYYGYASREFISVP